MTLEIEDQNGIKLVRLHGELVGDPDGGFVGAVTDLFAAPGTRIVVDLHDVRFLNSIGLSELVRVAAQANVQECRVVLAAPTPFVAGVLQTTQLDKFFEVTTTVEDALGRLA